MPEDQDSENRRIFLAWFSTILTMVGFVWQAAVLWTTSSDNTRRIAKLEVVVEDDSRRLAVVEATVAAQKER